jgi:hypothetical protein
MIVGIYMGAYQVEMGRSWKSANFHSERLDLGPAIQISLESPWSHVLVILQKTARSHKYGLQRGPWQMSLLTYEDPCTVRDVRSCTTISRPSCTSDYFNDLFVVSWIFGCIY